MVNTHHLKKQLSWELLNRRLDYFLTQSKQQAKKAKFGDKEFVYFDMTKNDDYELVVHTVSDRCIKKIVNSHEFFDGSPYISCSLVNPDLGLFKVNPSLLQASILFSFSASAITYMSEYDIGSPTNKYNSKNDQEIFLTKLIQQTFFASSIDNAMREIMLKRKIFGTSNSIRVPKIIEKITSEASAFEALRSADPKKGKIEALPFLSVDMLRQHTRQNQQPIPYNEILIKKSPTILKGILFNQSNWGNALKAIELNNIDAINAMNAIIEAELPIIIINNRFNRQYRLSQQPSQEEQLLIACKNHDLSTLEKLLQVIDATKFAGAALQEACYQGDLAMVKVLVAHHADVNFENGKCLQTAFYRGQINIAKYLIDNGALVEPCLIQLEDCLKKRPNLELSLLLGPAKHSQPGF